MESPTLIVLEWLWCTRLASIRAKCRRTRRAPLHKFNCTMNVYQAFFSLKDGVRDTDFVRELQAYMEYLKGKGQLKRWRLLRKKLGLAPKEFGDFHLMMEFEGLGDLDTAFQHVASRSGEVEEKHFAVNRLIENVTFFLYRDYPDPERDGVGLF